MGDRRALQAGTSHFMGQNFAKAFDIQFLDWNNQLQHAWTTSWGLSWRVIGAMVMTHGDNQGLVLPPKLAPFQVVIVPIYRDDTEKSAVLPVVERVSKELKGAGCRIRVDDREEVTPGFKFNDWEMRGVPLRLEIGPKDVQKNSVALARRDIPGKAGKSFISQEGLASQVVQMLDTIQQSMLERATAFRDSHIHEPTSYADLTEIVKDGWAYSRWCGDADCEAKVKEDTKATIRCLPLDQPEVQGVCIQCGKPATSMAYFARAY